MTNSENCTIILVVNILRDSAACSKQAAELPQDEKRTVIMKVDKLLGERSKNRPSECLVESHALMTRGGYLKNVSSGIFSLYTPARRSVRKIEQIIREEMDRIDGQECLFPVVMPASIWKESGRFYSIGDEMLRFQDRNRSDMVLGMTHEEAAVHLARDVASSYTRYPFMIYQIQTKFRDEPRARGGLIRVKEFTMKDAYSFHTSQEDLEAYYQVCYRAYERIFARVGIPEVIAVQSDSGMMGGKVSHEFMLLTDIGEDTLAICPECGFRSNMEVASCTYSPAEAEAEQPLDKIHTPDMKTIDALVDALHADMQHMIKAVVYQSNQDDSYVVAFIRADLEVNETKLRNLLGYEIHPANSTETDQITFGFIGPKGLSERVTVVYDASLQGRTNLICGANETDYHYSGFQFERDLGYVPDFVDIAKISEGSICPVCGKHSIQISKGIEVGNIFQLGTKYTEAMGMTYLDANGVAQTPIMGCYGIGVGRLLASVCEVRRDDYGPIWPISIAPWEVALCALRADEAAVRETADRLYQDLTDAGIELLYDDRNVSAGVMFSDADLLGCPIRVTVSPRNLANGEIELSTRDKRVKKFVPVENAVSEIRSLIAEEYAALSATLDESI